MQSFHQNVLSKADIIQATGDAILSLQEVPSLTPRGRYELKVYPTFLQLHGKTFDYKIPYNSILRVFILPHPDGRQMFFVVSFVRFSFQVGVSFFAGGRDFFPCIRFIFRVTKVSLMGIVGLIAQSQVYRCDSRIVDAWCHEGRPSSTYEVSKLKFEDVPPFVVWCMDDRFGDVVTSRQMFCYVHRRLEAVLGPGQTGNEELSHIEGLTRRACLSCVYISFEGHTMGNVPN